LNKKNNIDLLGGATLIIFSMLLGLNQTLVKIVNHGMHPIFQVGLRSFIAAIPVLIFCVLFKRKLSIWDGSFVPGVICGSIFALEFILLFFALEYTSVARSSILFYSMPVWLGIAAHFLFENEKLNFLKILGFSVSVIAVFIALFSRENSIQGNIVGDFFALCASFLWAAIVLIVRTTNLKNSSPEMQLLYQLVVSSILILPVCLYFDFYLREINIEIILIFLFQSLIIVAAGFLIWFWILSIYPASLMASYSFFGPIFGVFFGWFILSEEISIFLLLSLLLVCIGIYLININDSK
jgi:drug/metabolite transporter (DMT)-like permease|tara:strand:+ start:257 stop:1144 length:888 start_codon:yes stop_codon:yes gene_type:complete